uniref:RRM domain-containing protein n=1 Tax=Chaetoceros debilis TaxID=122233 RepID=A0A7S3PYQ9_9STRA
MGDNSTVFKKKTDKTVFFRYSPSDSSITRKNFESFFSDVGPVKKCSLIRQEKAKSENNRREAKGYGFCKFTSREDAVSAAKSLNEGYMQTENGQKVKVWVELADAQVASKKEDAKTQRKNTSSQNLEAGGANSTQDDEILQLQAKKRTSRVILRNLSFYATEHNIRQAMEEKFGEVVDINLPLVPSQDDGKGNKRKQHRGFAFVTFANPRSAHKAVDTCASDEQVMIKKRPVAIDFSVSKFQHKRMQEEDKGGNSKMDTESDEEDGSDEKIESDSQAGSGNSEGEDEESDSDDDNSESQEDASDTEEDSGDELSDSDEDEDDEQKEDKPKSITQKNSEEFSLFLRNLPFDATRHDLFTLFAQYGHIAGIYLVMDKSTGVNKGTAFVSYSKEGGSIRALEASNGSDSQDFESAKSMEGNGISGGGLYLGGRRIFVNSTVNKVTADSLKVERDEDGKPLEKKIGKDKRNLYLKGEGRVAEGGDATNNPDAWENIPESDQLKRGRAHQEKAQKLRSPLFFINPFRLSIRNLSKNVDEPQLKILLATGIKKGLEKKLIDKHDMMAHWRAGGEMTKREIISKVAASEKDGSLVPPFDDSKLKQFIPSVYIDRDFQVPTKQAENAKVSKLIAPSRGFGFAEFTHHAHAIACLRELNNNPAYSAEFVPGGKRAKEMKRQRSNKKQKKKISQNDFEDGPDGKSFVGDDGKVRVPRLVIEFTVENKAKARKQAERKAFQQANVNKQRILAKEAAAAKPDAEVKVKKSRGQKQREKKRKLKEAGLLDEDSKDVPTENVDIAKKPMAKKAEADSDSDVKSKSVKPPKNKKKKVDKKEEKFEDMVRSYRKVFANTAADKTDGAAAVNPRADVEKKRWFD